MKFVAHLVMLSGRVELGRPWVGPGWAKTSGLAIDPMRAGPSHKKSGPTLALLGLSCPSGQPGLALPADSVGGATGNGWGCGMWTAEVAERNWSVSLCRVKTWPQLMCCALV